jgi:hypothetical protein
MKPVELADPQGHTGPDSVNDTAKSTVAAIWRKVPRRSNSITQVDRDLRGEDMEHFGRQNIAKTDAKPRRGRLM